jgi:hypothetical protein
MSYQNWVDQDAFASEASPGLSKLQYAAIHIFAATMANRTKLFDGDKENREKNQVIYNIAEDCWNHARTLETMFEREKSEG